MQEKNIPWIFLTPPSLSAAKWFRQTIVRCLLCRILKQSTLPSRPKAPYLHFSPFMELSSIILRDYALCTHSGRFLGNLEKLNHTKTHVVLDMILNRKRISHIFNKKHIRLLPWRGWQQMEKINFGGESTTTDFYFFSHIHSSSLGYETSINFHQRDYCESFVDWRQHFVLLARCGMVGVFKNVWEGNCEMGKARRTSSHGGRSNFIE